MYLITGKVDRHIEQKDGNKYLCVERFMKIKFDSDDNLLLNKKLKFPTMTIIVRSVFEEDGKFYPQIYFDQCLYDL